jgi:hypothetical protein
LLATGITITGNALLNIQLPLITGIIEIVLGIICAIIYAILDDKARTQSANKDGIKHE